MRIEDGSRKLMIMWFANLFLTGNEQKSSDRRLRGGCRSHDVDRKNIKKKCLLQMWIREGILHCAQYQSCRVCHLCVTYQFLHGKGWQKVSTVFPKARLFFTMIPQVSISNPSGINMVAHYQEYHEKLLFFYKKVHHLDPKYIQFKTTPIANTTYPTVLHHSLRPVLSQTKTGMIFRYNLMAGGQIIPQKCP